VSPVRYELGSYIPENGILRSHRRVNLTSSSIIDFVYFLPSIVPYSKEQCFGNCMFPSSGGGVGGTTPFDSTERANVN
jgi:hypothetical protein